MNKAQTYSYLFQTYMVVVFPAPLCPRNDVICPSYNVRFNLLRAGGLLESNTCNKFQRKFRTVKQIVKGHPFSSFSTSIFSSEVFVRKE